MAGERKGITYEAFVKVALEELVRKGKLKGKVFWNEKPDAMTIEPDFTVGPNKDHPTHIFLVTHSGATGNSHMKFWRNMGELVEAKVRLSRAARVYSIVFDSVIKEDLKALQGAAFDGQLLVGSSDSGRRLLRWVEANSSGLPKDADEKVVAIQAAMKDRSRTDNPQGHLADLVRELGRVVQTTRTELDGLWSMERKRPVGRAPAARDTFVRRGVGKLLLLDHPDDIDAAGRLKKSVPKELVAALKTSRLAGDSIAGPRVTDPQMLWAVRTLSTAELRATSSVKSAPRIKEWLSALRGLAALPRQVAFIEKHWTRLCTPRGMYDELVRCHQAPSAIAPDLIPRDSRGVWLFHLVIEWIKLNGGTRSGYGLNAVLIDLDKGADRTTLRSILGREPVLSARRSVELGLTDWHSSPSKQHFAFSSDDLARVAIVLASRLRGCRKPSSKDDVRGLVDAVVQTNLEAKLLCYRHFDPVRVLIETALESAGRPWSVTMLRACFAEAASDGGARLDPRSSGTSVMRVGNTLVNWQSAHDSHTNDKRKELCGRAPALRYSWDPKKQAFAKRPSIERLFLILDGTWRQADLDALTRAGWDEIFYPDEMDKLVKAIV